MERETLYFLGGAHVPRLRGGKPYRKSGVHPRFRKGMLFRDMRSLTVARP